MKNSHIILIFAQDERGVIERISMLFRRKMYNIDQISASNTEKKGIKKITVKFNIKENNKISQILKQINKIVEVIKVVHVTNESIIINEVAFIKIKKDNEDILSKLEVIQELEVLNLSKNEVIVRIIQNPGKLKKIIEKIRKNFIINEITTSGVIVIEK